MIPEPGEMISHYRLVEKVGEGGMGLVFKALDTKLHRHVAIKLLIPELTADPERRLRFQREAQATAALNHPNIAVIYEIGDHEGSPFIAMEFVEGKALRAVLASGAIPPTEAIRLSTQIADGVARAHQAGIVHRDLKPENVILDVDGRPKILDFGLAKLRAGQETPLKRIAGDPDMDTISAEMTREGKILGTASYMSPEQARGEIVDHRSDIFSLGTNMYEMVTGRTPFEGATPMDTLSMILREKEAPARSLNPSIPAELERIITRCLEKSPEKRYEKTSELVGELRSLQRITDSQPLQAATPEEPEEDEEQPGKRRRPGLTMGAGFVAVAVLALLAAQWLGWFGEAPAPGPAATSVPGELQPERLTSNPPENWVTEGDISPDGSALAYADQIGLHVRDLESGETRDLPLPRGSRVYSLDWFPDGERVITSETSADGAREIWAISATSGTRKKLQENAQRGSVAPDGEMIAYLGGQTSWSTREIWLMGTGGQAPRKVLGAQGLELFSAPTWSPDSARIAFVRYKVSQDSIQASLESIDPLGLKDPVPASRWSLDLDENPPVGESVLVWLADGRVVMIRSGQLYQVQVDPYTGEALDEAASISDWRAFEVHEISATSDGRRIAFQNRQRLSDVHLAGLADGGKRLLPPERLTLGDGQDFNPAWSPDSREVFFHSDRNGTWDIFGQKADSLRADPLVAGPNHEILPRLTPDGTHVLFWMTAANGGTEPSRLMRVPAGGGEPVTILEVPAGASLPGVRCGRVPGSRCVLGQPDEEQILFYDLNPLAGRGEALSAIAFPSGDLTGVSWDLSPDGTRIAALEPNGAVRITEAGGRPVAAFLIEGAQRFHWVSWTAEGDRLLVIAREPSAKILSVDLRGEAIPLWEPSRTTFVALEPAPDGRRLAVTINTEISDIWSVEGI